MSQLGEQCVFISAANRTNIDELRLRLTSMVKEIHLVRVSELFGRNSEPCPP